MADLSEQIEDAATSPAAASADGQSVTARPVSEVIAADQHLAQKTAVTKRHRGLRFNRISLPRADE